MKNFIKEISGLNGRWNRLKFWLYPIIIGILTVVILIINSILPNGNIIKIKESKVISNISYLNNIFKNKLIEGIQLNNYQNKNNLINYSLLKINGDEFKNPFGGEYKIFIKDNKYQIYGETPNKIIIRGNYYKEKGSPSSLVIIDGVLKEDGEKINSNKSYKIIYFIMPLILAFIKFLFIYIVIIAFIKRLKDLDKNPWLTLLLFIPLVNIYLLIICGFYKGTKGINKYGHEH